MKAHKIMVFDTETTGTTEKDWIVQFSAITLAYPSLHIISRCDVKMRPPRYSERYAEAFKVQGRSWEEVKKWPSQMVGWSWIFAFLRGEVDALDRGDKMYLAGWNVGFDVNMLTNNFRRLPVSIQEKNHLGAFFNWRAIDVLGMVNMYEMMCGAGTFPERKLSYFARLLNIDLYAHDSMNDVIATVEIFRRIEPHIRKGDVLKFFERLIRKSRCTTLCAKQGTSLCEFKPMYACFDDIYGKGEL